MTQETPSLPIDGAGLATLEARLREDLEYLCYPGKEWVPKKFVAAERVTDVVIVGGGMCGMLAWHALRSAGILNVRVLDRSPEGFEGPWLIYARMETLRSPKTLTGPAFGHGALTFQAWFRSQFGTEAWERLDKIPRPMWMEYLRWYRKVLDVPIENGVSLDRVEPEGDLLRLHLSGNASGSVLVRKLVMATGRDGTAEPTIPAFMKGVPRRLWAHSSDDIDFAALRGKRVVVVGAGASAVDNAAEALEHGAAEVRHLIRREKMPTVNKMMGIGSFGFTFGYQEMSDAWRWRFMRYSFVTQTPSPRGSTLRVSRHPNAYFHFGVPVTEVAEEDGTLRVTVGTGDVLTTDFLILGTGFRTDPKARREFGPAAAEIRLWRDAYTPPPGEESRELSLFPYLNEDFTFAAREEGAFPWLASVYCFNYGATASLGKVSGDIPGVSEGAQLLARSIAARLYVEDIEIHWQRLLEYETPELIGDEWTESPLPSRRGQGGGGMSGLPETTVTAMLGPLSAPVSAALAGRAGILKMTQAAEDAVLKPVESGRFRHAVRTALAARIAALHDDAAMAEHYRAMVADPATRAICDPDNDGASAGLRAECAFVDKVAARTRLVAASDISDLREAQIADPDIVRLAELVAFMAYQLRLIAGIRLMNGAAA